MKEDDHGERAFALHCVIVGVRAVAQALAEESRKGSLIQVVPALPQGMAAAAERLQALKGKS